MYCRGPDETSSVQTPFSLCLNVLANHKLLKAGGRVSWLSVCQGGAECSEDGTGK